MKILAKTLFNIAQTASLVAQQASSLAIMTVPTVFTAASLQSQVQLSHEISFQVQSLGSAEISPLSALAKNIESLNSSSQQSSALQLNPSGANRVFASADLFAFEAQPSGLGAKNLGLQNIAQQTLSTSIQKVSEGPVSSSSSAVAAPAPRASISAQVQSSSAGRAVASALKSVSANFSKVSVALLAPLTAPSSAAKQPQVLAPVAALAPAPANTSPSAPVETISHPKTKEVTAVPTPAPTPVAVTPPSPPPTPPTVAPTPEPVAVIVVAPSPTPTPTPSEYDTQLAENKFYRLRSSCDPKKVVAVEHNDSGQGGSIVTSDFESYNLAQQIYLEKDPRQDGAYNLLFGHDEQAMDVSWASADSGTPIIQWPTHGGANQAFHFINQGSGIYKVQAVHSGLYLTTQNRNSNNLTQEKDSESCSQKFVLEVVVQDRLDLCPSSQAPESPVIAEGSSTRLLSSNGKYLYSQNPIDSSKVLWSRYDLENGSWMPLYYESINKDLSGSKSKNNTPLPASSMVYCHSQ